MGCTSLDSITLPNSITYIQRDVFNGCNISYINIPSGITEISYHAFHGMGKLKSINIPEGVITIGEFAFEDCSSLVSAIIPSTVTSIGSNVFRGCNELRELYCFAKDVPYVSGNLIGNEPYYVTRNTNTMLAPETRNVYEDAILYVPSVSLEAYKTTSPWDKFKTIIPIESSGIDKTNNAQNVRIETIHDMNGLHVNSLQRGINIVRMSDGTIKKVITK